jgi:hypothetical protein
MVTRGCAQCGVVYTPRREHARFCSSRCRVNWNREHLTDAAAEERALEWSLAGMRDVVERLARHRPADERAAFNAVAEAVWWVTIIDARMIRQYTDLYDALLAHVPDQRPLIEGTLSGLRFVRNQMCADPPPTGFIESPIRPSGRPAVTAAWRWAHRPVTALSISADTEPWAESRLQAYEQWLAGHGVGQVFQRAAAFVHLAATRATALDPAS